jgi:hypothetical protein
VVDSSGFSAAYYDRCTLIFSDLEQALSRGAIFFKAPIIKPGRIICFTFCVLSLGPGTTIVFGHEAISLRK